MANRPIRIALACLLGCVAATAGGTSGCASDGPLDEEVSSVGQPLWSLASASFWPAGTVPVCFQPRINHSGVDESTTANYTLQTTRIQQVLEAQFEHIDGVSIDFSGWGACGPAIPHSRTATFPTTGLNPPIFGPVVAGSLKIMIQCDEPQERATYGWQVPNASGYRGATNEQRLWTSQSKYTWGDAWDSTVEHEGLHVLGFEHEYDRSDRTQDCTAIQQLANGNFWTSYDHHSAANDGYCDGFTPGLSGLDELGLAMVYPDGSPIALRGRNGFSNANGVVMRADDELVTDWTRRGATDTGAFTTYPTWTAVVGTSGTITVTSPTLPASSLGANSISTVSGNFVDHFGRDKELEEANVEVNDTLHTALVLAALGR